MRPCEVAATSQELQRSASARRRTAILLAQGQTSGRHGLQLGLGVLYYDIWPLIAVPGLLQEVV
jgi:hypothetical protein